MKTKLLVVGGIMLILAGIYGLIRPNILMPAKREKLQIAGQEVQMETRRVVGVPRPLSGMVILSGVALILLSVQKP